MKFLSALLLGSILAVSAAVPAQAAPVTYTFDKPHTQVLFFVNHLGFSNSLGRFLDYDGKIVFDQAAPEKSSVDVTIKTASIDMGDEKWDAHLKNADFFNVEKFPDMTFKSTSIKVIDDKNADITGDLTILGVTKPVILKTAFNNAGKHPMNGKDMAGFSATTTIKRSDFGMNYGLPMVSDDVKIMIEVEAIADTAAPAAQ